MYRVEFVDGMAQGTAEYQSNGVCFLCDDPIDVPDAGVLCFQCRLANGDTDGGLLIKAKEAYLTYMQARFFAVKDRPKKRKALFGM